MPTLSISGLKQLTGMNHFENPMQYKKSFMLVCQIVACACQLLCQSRKTLNTSHKLAAFLRDLRQYLYSELDAKKTFSSLPNGLYSLHYIRNYLCLIPENYHAKYSDFSMSLYRKIVYKNGERLNELSIQLIKSLLFRRCPMVFFKEIMSALCQTADFS